MAEHIGSVYVEVLPDADKFADRFRARAIPEMERAGAEAGAAWSRGFRAAAGDMRIRPDVDTAAARAQLLGLRREVEGVNKAGNEASRGGLMKWLLTLSPAISPLAGAAGAAAAAFGAMGVTGAIAFKAIKDEQKAGTPAGKEYAAGLGQIKFEAKDLETTVARGLLPAFDKVESKLVAFGPTARTALSGLSAQTGDIVQHLVGGGVGGLSNFGPLLSHVLDEVDDVAAGFERWATGPGGAKFADTLSKDFDEVVPVLRDTVSLVEKVTSAANGPGLGILSALDTFIRGLDAFPEGAWEAFVTGFVTLRAASGISALFTRASVSIGTYTRAEVAAAIATRELTAAQREQMLAGGGAGLAGARRGGVRGAAAAGLGRVGPAAGATLAGMILFPQLAKSTESWRTSNNDFKFVASNEAKFASDLFTGHWGSLGSDLTKPNSRRRDLNNLRTQVGETDAAGLNWDIYKQRQLIGSSVNNLRGQQLAGGVGTTASAIGNNNNVEAITRQQDNIIQGMSQIAEDEKLLRVLGDTTDRVAGKQRQLRTSILGTRDGTVAQASSIGQVQQAYSAYDEQLAAITAKDKSWLDVKKGDTVEIDNNTYSVAAWNKAVKQAGGDTTKAVGILEGHRQAYAADREEAAKAAAQEAKIEAAYAKTSGALGITTDQVDLYRQSLGITFDQIGIGLISADDFEHAIAQVKTAIDDGDTATQGWIASLTQFDAAADTAASRGQLIGAALRASNGDAIAFGNTMVSAAEANQQFVTDLANVKTGVLNLKTGTLDYHNAAAGPLLQDLDAIQNANVNAAAAIYQHELKQKGGKQAALDAYQTYYNNTRPALIDEATKVLGNADAAQKFIDKYFTIKNAKDLRKQITLIGEDKVQTALAAILTDLDILAGKTTLLHIDIVANNTVAGAAGVGKGSAGRARVVSAYGNLVAFGRGGFEDHSPAIYNARPGTVRVFAEPDTGWEAYIPGANDSRRPRAKAIATEAVRRLGGTAHFETGGFTGVDYSGTGGDGTKSTANGSKAKAAPAFDSSALTAFLNTIGITTNAFTDAKNQLISALRQSKVSTGNLAALSREATRLIADSKVIATETARISKAQEYRAGLVQQSASTRSSVASSILGLFDLSSAGVQQQVYRDQPAAGVTGAGILASLTSAANKGVRTQGYLAKLKGRIPNALYEQLASNAGQDQDQIAALASSSAGTLSAIGGQYGRLNTAAGKTGSAVADQLFGSKIDAATALLNGFDPKRNPALASAVKSLSNSLFGAGKETARGLAMGIVSEKKTLVAAMGTLAHTLEDQIRKDLHIKSPSRKMQLIGTQVTQGIVAGIVQDLPAVRTAMTRVAGEVTFDPAGSSAAGPAGQNHRHYHLHGLDDPAAFQSAVIRREQRLADV